MIKHCRVTLLSLFVILGLAGQSALAAPQASPKAFAGSYTISGFSTSPSNVNRGYQGIIKISSTGKVSGRIKSTNTTFATDGAAVSKTSRVVVTGKIAEVKKATHAGYKILEATTKIKLSDGAAGTLAIMYPYTVKPTQMSGYGTIKNGTMKISMSVQKQ